MLENFRKLRKARYSELGTECKTSSSVDRLSAALYLRGKTSFSATQNTDKCHLGKGTKANENKVNEINSKTQIISNLVFNTMQSFVPWNFRVLIVGEFRQYP